MQTMTVKEYADRVGVSFQRIYSLMKSGQISRKAIIKKGNRKLLNVQRADEDYCRNCDPARVRFTIPDEPDLSGVDASTIEQRQAIADAGLDDPADYNASRALHEHYKAALKKLEFEQKEGKLVSAEIVEKQAFEFARGIRDAFLAVPNRVSAVLAVETDKDQVAAILTGEIRSILYDLADEPEFAKRELEKIRRNHAIR